MREAAALLALAVLASCVASGAEPVPRATAAQDDAVSAVPS